VSDDLETPALPFWMEGAETGSLASSAQSWFQKLGQVALLPARQLDPLTCQATVLDLIAWQRGVTRYRGEPERAYRLRVAYAYANAKDAGSVAGWGRIFQRLEVGEMDMEERMDGQDWDVLGVVLSDEDLSENQRLVEIIIEEYGRTCRRYRLVSRQASTITARLGRFDHDQMTVCAAIPPLAMGVRLAVFENAHSTMEACA